MVYYLLVGSIAFFLVVLVAMLAGFFRRIQRAVAEKTASQNELAQKIDIARDAPGGSAENPIAIETPVLVEAKAEDARCLRCDTPMRVEGHAAKTMAGRPLRVAELRCPRCEARRELYFELMRPS